MAGPFVRRYPGRYPRTWRAGEGPIRRARLIANAVLYATVGRGAPGTRFRTAEIVQIDEANHPILSNLEAIGAELHQTPPDLPARHRPTG